MAGKRWISSASSHGCWLGTCERELQSLLAGCVKPGDTVFDVGVNVGFFSLLGSSLVGEHGRVCAFEPLPRNVSYLKRHVRMNRITNVEIVESTVAEANGTGYMANEAGNPSMAGLGESGANVRLVSLDSFVVEHRIPPPAVIKCDVEGAESRVLEGATTLLTNARPRIFLSTHGWEQNRVCSEMLADLGYRVVSRRDGSSDGQYELVASPTAG